MSKATIDLIDVDGEVQMILTCEGGFDVASNAHQHAYMCLKHLEEVCEMSKHDVQASPDTSTMAIPFLYTPIAELVKQ